MRATAPVPPHSSLLPTGACHFDSLTLVDLEAVLGWVGKLSKQDFQKVQNHPKWSSE